MPEDPTGSVVRNLFLLQRFGTTLSAEANELLLELFDDLAAEIARLDPTSPPQETYRRQRIDKIVGATEELAGETFEEIRKRLRQRLAELGSEQSDWASEQLARTIGSVGVDLRPGAIGVNRMKRIIDADPFRGETLAGWTETQSAATVRRVRRQIQLGMTQNEDIGALVRRVRGTFSSFIRQDPDTGRFVSSGGRVIGRRFEGGVLQTTTREAEAIVRTAVNFVSNRGHLETYRENGRLLEGLDYTATLDSGTTIICANLDGNVYDVDDPDIPLPPNHHGCRSIMAPVVAWRRLDIEPPDIGTRASADGQVKASTTYEQWLRDQPPEVQDEVLRSPTRAKLFRSGKASLRDMVTRDNEIVPVSELLKSAA